MRFFKRICLITLVFVASALPIARAYALCDLGPFIAKLIHSEPSYMTGMVARLTDGRLIFTHGTIFDPHVALLKYTNTITGGKVQDVLWVGEMLGQDGKLKVVNATAGMMNPEDPEKAIEKLGIAHKESNAATLKKLIEEHPELKKQISEQTRWVEFDKNAPIEDMHIAPELKRIKDLRHDFRGVVASFEMGANHIEAYAKDNPAHIQGLIKENAAKLLKDAQTLETYHYRSTTLGKQDVQKLIQLVKQWAENGVPESKTILKKDLVYLKIWVEAIENGTGLEHSIELNSVH